jgi:hypothetical protein
MIKEGIMIYSPCVNCHKKNQPKERCAKDCKILHAIQIYQAVNERESIFPAIDYAEEGRFYVNNVELFK